MGEWLIDVSGLSKSFAGKTAVSGVDLQVRPGEVFGVIGPNGSGKTTTIRMLCGLMTPDQGSGHCLGFDIREEQDKIKTQVGYMPQKFSYYSDLSVYENLMFIARLHHVPNPRERVRHVCEQLGLDHRMSDIAGILSGGWKQRMSLAASMMHKPKLLLLDEPTAGVDPKSRRDFWGQIHEVASSGVTVLVSTHFMDEAVRCDRLAYILYGHKIAEGTEREIIEQSGLKAIEVSGGDLRQLQIDFEQAFSDIPSAMFSGRLHITLSKEDEDQSVVGWFEARGCQADQVDATIEEVFIHMTDHEQSC